MDQRLEHILAKLTTFAFTRPVAYGVPVCAAIGALAGMVMRPGAQEANYAQEMEPVRTVYTATAEPISWPAGKLPDYVVGTDFVKAQQPPPVQMVSYTPSYAPPPAPEVPPYVPGEHGPATPPPSSDAPHWASQRGDILDVSLPEDRQPGPVPTVLADAAATGMTTR